MSNYRLWALCAREKEKLSASDIVEVLCCNEEEKVLAWVIDASGGEVLTLCLDCDLKFLWDKLPTASVGPLYQVQYRRFGSGSNGHSVAAD